jgi:hypothetical protein
MRAALAGLVVLLLPGLAGCQLVSAMTYMFNPEQKVAAEFTPTHERLAIVMDTAPGLPDNAVFRQALHDRLVTLLHEHKLCDDVAPYTAQLDLQSRYPDYARWSVPRIGRELRAVQVLYVRIVALTLRETPDYPVFEPRVRVRLSAHDPTPPGKRLWPSDPDGRELEVTCPPEEGGGPAQEDRVVQKLGRSVAEHAIRLFYEHPADDKPPIEP